MEHPRVVRKQLVTAAVGRGADRMQVDGPAISMPEREGGREQVALDLEAFCLEQLDDSGQRMVLDDEVEVVVLA